ncbi:MAG: HEPN domain-containing protein [Pseudomonadota bacterium]
MSAPEDSRWLEARRWFAVANEDLRVARACLTMDEPALGAAAYHCQQAVEKLMKGLLVAGARPFRKIHDLDELAEAATAVFPGLRPHLDACRPFTRWGTALRYPEIGDEALVGPTAADIASALPRIEALAAAVAELGSGRR